MASAITHAVTACTIGYALRPVGPKLRFYALAASCSIAPDLDVYGFSLGIEYEDLLGHRGLSHSLLAALALGLAVSLVVYRPRTFSRRDRTRATVALVLATASHGVLDALTDGGLGVAFLSPFDATRYFAPWHPIVVSPIGIRSFFGEWGLAVLRSEIVAVWLPCAVAVMLTAASRRAPGTR